MELLQRNDWPDTDSGVLAAYHLTLPNTEGQGEGAGCVRSWRAEEEWLDWPRFHAQLHVTYGPLLHCDSWRPVSPLVFPSSRHENRAVQAVDVRARPRRQQQAQQQQGSGAAAGAHDGEETSAGLDMALRTYTYTFCLERQEAGAFKDCWLISGVRVGNYAL